MKIAVIGAGMTGAYLYSLLDKKKHTVHIFDKDPGTKCGISPCAWGTSNGFPDLVRASGLDPEQYILTSPKYLLMDDLKLKADLMTFDKQRLIKDLMRGAEVIYSKPDTTIYARIIDATGISRVFLPPIWEDLALPCIQFRVRADGPMENRIKLGRVGYAWFFPLSDGSYHVGCGSLVSDPRRILKELRWMEKIPREQILCACSGSIRITGPQHSLPFVTLREGREVWGVGEAIGCVAPLAGDGIIPGMRSVQLLLDHWDDPSAYEKAILKEFAWMAPERRVVDALKNNAALRLADAWVLKKNSRRMGMDVGVKEALLLLKHLM